MSDGKKESDNGQPLDLAELLEDLEQEDRTMQVDMSAPPGAGEIDPVDLSLPEQSADPALPFFLPPDRQSLKPRSPGAGSRTPEPPRTRPQGPNISTFFDGLELDEEDSLEIPVHELPEQLQSEQVVGQSPTPPPASASTPTPTPDSRRRFARGFTAGRRPLDGGQFQQRQGRPSKRRRDTDELPLRRGPVPMADSRRLVRRRFLSTVTFRDIVLLLLVAVLAAGVYVGWLIYRDYSQKQEIARMERGRQIIETRKGQQIQRRHQAREPEKDIP